MRHPFHPFSTLVLVAYLALFSSAALVHAYAQDELVDAHGCVIGAWVQQATATDAAAAPIAPLCGLSEFFPPSSDTVPHQTALGLTSRGPPHYSS